MLCLLDKLNTTKKIRNHLLHNRNAGTWILASGCRICLRRWCRHIAPSRHIFRNSVSLQEELVSPCQSATSTSSSDSSVGSENESKIFICAASLRLAKNTSALCDINAAGLRPQSLATALRSVKSRLGNWIFIVLKASANMIASSANNMNVKNLCAVSFVPASDVVWIRRMMRC